MRLSDTMPKGRSPRKSFRVVKVDANGDKTTVGTTFSEKEANRLRDVFEGRLTEAEIRDCYHYSVEPV